ncbi:uncharacterized protein TNCV_792941 [Trichonephila clavipes]|nr:uncharacterized protein TNCV_792941 [Trichonephila clavipes]
MKPRFHWSILPEKAQEHIEGFSRNITSCQNEVGTLGTKDEEVTAEMDKGSMVADSFRSEKECCAELALVWKQAKEGKGNYYEVDGYLFRRDKILGESIGQLGLSSNVKKFCESCKECQLTRSVRIKDRSPITPVARSELPFQVVNMDLIGPIDPPSSKGHTYILCLVDQHTRWGEARPVTSLSAEGLPSEAEEENCDLIVLDDMMNDVTSEISQMFTMGSHHKKYSIILITQNLFPRVKSMRDISLNAHYIILFRNNRDVSQAACFGRQAFPGRGKFFMDSYKKATEEPFSYLLVDVHPRSPEVQRLPAASPAQRKAILKSATDDQIKTLCEICDNLLSGNIPTKKIKKLCSYKRVIRLLANRSVPISRKRKLFTTNRQVGGFLPLILPGVLSLLGGIAGKAIGKRI